jgi:hypothetical protein
MFDKQDDNFFKKNIIKTFNLENKLALIFLKYLKLFDDLYD